METHNAQTTDYGVTHAMAAPIAASSTRDPIGGESQIPALAADTPATSVLSPSHIDVSLMVAAAPSAAHAPEADGTAAEPTRAAIPTPAPAPACTPTPHSADLPIECVSGPPPPSWLCTRGFLFLLLNRSIEEGEEFLLWSYPRPADSPTIKRILTLKGVISVLEGAVAGVTGQHAVVATIEELTRELENSQDPPPAPTPYTADRPPTLKLKVATRELSGMGAGLVFVCLTWSPRVSDSQLTHLTRNLLNTLRLTIGTIHCRLFKPPTALNAEENKQQATTPSTPSPAAPSVTNSDLWPSSFECHARRAEAKKRIRLAFDQSVASHFTDLTTIISPSNASELNSPPIVAAAPVPPVDLDDRLETAPQLDTFFRRAEQTICHDLLAAVGGGLSGPSVPPVSSPHSPHSPSLPRPVLSSHARSTFLSSSSFLSTHLVPSFTFPHSDSGAPNRPVIKLVETELTKLVQDLSTNPSTPIIGALLFHRGALVHVASAADVVAPPNAPFTRSMTQPADDQPHAPTTNTNSSTTARLRQQDVHEIANLLTLLDLFTPQPVNATGAHATSAESQSSISSSNVRIRHAATHQLWFKYTPAEVSASESYAASGAVATHAVGGRVSLAASRMNLTISTSAAVGSSAGESRIISSPRSGHTRNATVAGLSPTLPTSPSAAPPPASAAAAASTLGGHEPSPDSQIIVTPAPTASATIKRSASGEQINNIPAKAASSFASSLAASARKVYRPRCVSILSLSPPVVVGDSSSPPVAVAGVGGELVLVVVHDDSGPLALSTLQSRALRATAEKSPPVTAHTVQQEFFFACPAVQPHRIYDALYALYHTYQVHLLLDQAHAVGITSGAEANAREVIARIVESTAHTTQITNNATSPTTLTTPPTPLMTHARSYTSANILTTLQFDATGGGTSVSHRVAPPSKSPLVLSDGARILDYLFLDYGRGVIVRSPLGDSSAPPSSPRPDLPRTLRKDFTALTARMHRIFTRFQHANTNWSTPIGTVGSIGHLHARAPSMTFASPLTFDPNASHEELGRGNQLHFRKHKTIDIIRHVDECGFRVSYPFGPAFWFRGRLLSTGVEVYVCCDETMPSDMLEQAFRHMHQ